MTQKSGDEAMKNTMLSILIVFIITVVNLTSAVSGYELFVEQSSVVWDEESSSALDEQNPFIWDEFEFSDSDDLTSETIFEDSTDNVDAASENPYYEGNDTVLQIDEYESDVYESEVYETETYVSDSVDEEPHDEEVPEVDAVSDDASYTIEDTITESFIFEQHASAEALFSEYVDFVFSDPAFSKINARDVLGTSEKAVYDAISGYLPEIASGKRSSTEFDIPVKNLGFSKLTWTAYELGLNSISSGNMVSEEAKDAAIAKIDSNISRACSALLEDYPYLLYWFDKTGGIGRSYSLSGTSSSISIVGNIRIRMSVAKEYAIDQFHVNTSVGQAVHNAHSRALQIVEQYKYTSDYDKLLGYKDTICSLTDYNHAAANGDYPYGNPWQMIWVFDGDPETKVVCEGYSKAFKYLCDQSEFTEDISCFTVTGTMNGGRHMWNIVSVASGSERQNYLADVTNSDTASVGSSGGLFLVGSKKNLDHGYRIDLRYKEMTYLYGEETCNLFDNAFLNLSGNSYVEDHKVPTFTVKGYEGIYDGQYHGITIIAEEGARVSYGAGTLQFYKDAGTYTVDYQVEKEGSKTVTGSATVTIGRKAVDVSGITAADKVYDGNTRADLLFNKVVIDGIVDGDTLAVTAEGTFENADVGDHKAVFITGIELVGDDAKNYRLAGQQTTTTASILEKEPSDKAKEFITEVKKIEELATPEVRAAIDKALNDYEALGEEDREYSGVATAKEELDRINKSFQAIEEAAENVKAQIEKLSNDQEDIETVKAAYDALTEEQKTLIPESAREKLQKALESINDTGRVDAFIKAVVEAKGKPDEATSIFNTLTDGQKNLIPAETMALYEEELAAYKSGRKFRSGDAYYKVLSNGDVTYLYPADKGAKNATVPNQVKKGKFKFKVIKISAGAFKNCKSLEWVVINKNIRVIGEDAFKNTPALRTINVKGSGIQTGKAVKAFNGAGKDAGRKLTVKVPKTKYTEYKSLFKGEGKLNQIAFIKAV